MDAAAPRGAPLRRTTRAAAIHLGLASALLLAAAPARAQDGAATFTGRISAGYRTVGVGGTGTKYQEDINLAEGPRLFGVDLVLEPDGDLGDLVDRVDLNLSNFGGDPFESMRLSVRNYGRFDFTFDHTRSTYFYEDTILPPDLADPETVDVGDLHHFNFDRVKDSAKLGLHLSDAAKVTFAFDRFTKLGSSTTTIDFERADVEMDKPLDESLNDFTAGFQYDWSGVTLIVSEGLRDYENVVDVFLPGSATSGPTTIDFYTFDQPYDYRSHTHTLQLLLHPSSTLTVKASGIVQTLDLNLSGRLRSAGVDFGGTPYDVDESGDGANSSDSQLLDLDATYLLSPRVGLIGGIWYRNRDQDGRSVLDGEAARGRWSLGTTGGRAGVQVSPSDRIVVSGGLQYETRDVTTNRLEPGATDPERESLTTDATGFFADATWRPTARLRLTGEAESGSYDGPYTSKSFTGRRRFRVRGRYELRRGFYVSASYLKNAYENDDSGWDAHYDMTDLRFGYQQGAVSGSAGYGRVDTSRQIDRMLSAGQLFMVDYQGTADFYDGQLRWTASPRWTVGAEARFYRNAGSFGIERDDARAFAEYALQEAYVLHADYRHVRYDERDANFDDYDADIAEFSIGYQW